MAEWHTQSMPAVIEALIIGAEGGLAEAEGA
jgi:hypothetical protein